MKKPRSLHLTIAQLLAIAGTSLSLLNSADAQVPTMISYQGRVLMNNTNFGGTGQFKFALVRGPGPTLLWKNDGSAGNTEPTAAVSLPVANGLVMTSLGDSALANMTALPPAAFEQPDVRLRVWFNGGSGFQQLTPDQRIVSVGYALMAGNVPDGVITAAKLAPGVLSPANFPNNSVTSAQLGDDLDLGSPSTIGRLDVYRNATGTPSITLDGSAASISTFGSDGLEQIRLHGTTFGELLLRNSLPNNATAVNLTAQGSTGGRLSLNNTNGSSRAILEGENIGGLLTLYTADGNVGAVLYGNEGAGSGALSLRNTNGAVRFRAYGGPAAGRMLAYNAAGQETVDIDAEPAGLVAVRNAAGSTRSYLWAGGTEGGEIRNYEADGTLTTWIHNVSDSGVVSVRNSVGGETVYLWGEDSDGTSDGQLGLKKASGTETITLQAGEGAGGAQLLMRNAAGQQTVQLDSDAFTASGYLALYKSNGVASIVLDASDGTVSAQVVEITGGSDFSEKFDINATALEPGMIVSIDPKNPGQLTLCESAHDKKVAGIVSGAGGVKPGMLMGQAGSIADGKHPVALTGRVFCWVDADANGAIEPGDMLTTSSTAGHGMKVTDHSRSTGAVVGKAMTPLAKGKGLVLVLVNLQ
jgi:hypothetical protein